MTVADRATLKVQSCQADMQGYKATAINEPKVLLPADLSVCSVLLNQSRPD